MIIQHVFSKNSCMRIKFFVSLIFVNPTSIYAVLFSSLHLLLNKDPVITPASIYAVLFSSPYLLFNKDVFITPASIYTEFFSSIQRLYFMQLRVIFNKSHFCWCKQLFSSFQLLFTQ